MTKQIFARGIAKAVPVIGAVTSGGLTFATFRSMSEKLRKYLASGELASVEYYKNIATEAVIGAETMGDIEHHNGE